ncbi:hypothetical protein Cgig2_020005 [Carnegiea gigantea]|uniref:Poly(A) polymerase nucleotidyltransferase domain-containing protein n=1 Tax=Carnegiea gigantea TaxID=171969 RepID=A0A9Q1KDP8_9CARY|nr:hypothetical protein Cgig2_020005 [Carnegiea gigantea]
MVFIFLTRRRIDDEVQRVRLEYMLAKASFNEDFFVVLCNMLKNTSGVLDVHSGKDAKVPLMRFKFEGISVNLPYAQLQLTSVPETKDNISKGMLQYQIGKNKLTQNAADLFAELEKEGLQTDTRAYTELIGAYFRADMGDTNHDLAFSNLIPVLDVLAPKSS